MVLYLEHMDGSREFFNLNEISDFEPIFERFPETRTMTLFASSFREAALEIAHYLSSHHMHAWVEAEDISKSLKEVAAKIGIAGALLMPGHISNKSPAPHVEVKQSHTEDFGSSPEDSFLNTIQHLESSGGQNIKHSEIKRGPSAGETAIGKWGLLKPTIHEILSREKKKGTLPNHLKILTKMNRNALDHHFKNNPNVELQLARLLARHVLDRQKGNVEKSAYAWLHGHNLHPHQISINQLSNSDYVKKFKNLHAPLRSVASISKAESVESFADRLKYWKKKREEMKRKPMMRDHTFVPDPGRVRNDKDLDPQQDSTVEKLKAIIESNKAKKE